jgi:hypothetical protein
MYRKRRSDAQRMLGDDFGDDTADAGAGQTYRASRARGQVQYPAANERAAVIDGNDHTAVAMGYPEPGPKRQRAVGACHRILIETLARRGFAAGFVAVIRRYPGEAASQARQPTTARSAIEGAAGVMGMAIAVMMMSMRFSRSFGDAPADQKSCGEKRERRARLGCSSQCRVFRCKHNTSPSR